MIPAALQQVLIWNQEMEPVVTDQKLGLREVLDRVETHLLRQGVCSEDHVCCAAYRGKFGNRCAIGCLIEDRWYAPAMEGLKSGSDVIIEALRRSGIDVDAPNMLCLLDSLQSIHDTFFPEEWRHELQRLRAGWAQRMSSGNE